MPKTLRKYATFLVLAVLLFGCSPSSTDETIDANDVDNQSSSNASKEVSSEDTVSDAQPDSVAVAMTDMSFGDVPKLSRASITPSLVDTATVATAAENYAEVLEFIDVELSPAQTTFLDEHKFLLIPLKETRFSDIQKYNSFDKMLTVFDVIGGTSSIYSRQAQHTRLVTPDVVLHGFHKFFENSLEYLEEHELAETLRRFVSGMREQLVVQKKSTDGEMAARYENLAAQFTVAQILLENANWSGDNSSIEHALDDEDLSWEERMEKEAELKRAADATDTIDQANKMLATFTDDFSADNFQKIKKELELIYAAENVISSPLFNQYKKDKKADYTQYTPRSHYVKNSRLRAYFRTMMYLGRNSYFFEQDEGISDAILLAHLLSEKDTLLADWQSMMAVTGFYAGESDDIAYPEWSEFLTAALDKDEINPDDAFEPDAITTIRNNLGDLRSPRILSDVIIHPDVFQKNKEELLDDTKAFRVFGQRFTFDAWVLNRLTAGQELTEPKLPSTPSALFVSAAFGDETARGFAGEFLKQDAQFSDQEVSDFFGKLDEVALDIAKVTDREWFGSIGTAWTNVLSALTQKFGSGYPLYMQSQLFPVKQIQTFLGSYAELKHDTILYAKQSYAELGGGGADGDPPPVPKGFVEPNLEFWYTLQALVDYTINGFERHQLFPLALEEWGALGRFSKQVDFYTALAEKELRGEQISDEEYEELRTFGLDYLAQPFDAGTVLDEDDKRVALIADIHTDALRSQILYEATGEPFIMLALVGNENTPRIVTGLAFNHYELTAPLGGNRLTDQDWQQKVYETPSELPEKNFWYQDLIIK